MENTKVNNNSVSEKVVFIDQEKLWGVEELAEYLNVRVSKIYSLTRQKGPNSIPRYKIDRYLRFVKDEIDSWLDSKRIGFRP